MYNYIYIYMYNYIYICIIIYIYILTFIYFKFFCVCLSCSGNAGTRLVGNPGWSVIRLCPAFHLEIWCHLVHPISLIISHPRCSRVLNTPTAIFLHVGTKPVNPHIFVGKLQRIWLPEDFQPGILHLWCEVSMSFCDQKADLGWCQTTTLKTLAWTMMI